MKIYTGKGDKGNTSILGKDKLPKDDPRIEAYGTIDELNSVIGRAINEVGEELTEHLKKSQHVLFEIGSELSSEKPRNKLNEEDVRHLEKLIDKAQNKLPELKNFILPGGSIQSSWLHMARTVARRAERRIVTLQRDHEINEYILPWINRYSDLLFVYARLENKIQDVGDVKWRPRE